MGITATISRLFSRKPSPVDDAPAGKGIEIMPAEKLRRFQAAQPTRLNREQFAQAHGESINTDLAGDLPVLQARCAFEFSSNPLFEGVVNTFKDDVVGRNGPLLQVNSDNDAFNEAVESAFKVVMADPDPSHRFGGVEVMKTWVHGLLLAGSYVNVNANVRRPTSPITYGWRTVHARRLASPAQLTGDPNVAFGVRLNPKTGEAVEYYIDKPQQLGAYTLSNGDYETIPAAAVQHCFIPIEPEQLTGYPMLTSALETACDLRQYDQYVMKAAKNAAGLAVGLQSQGADAQINPDPIDSTCVDFEPDMINVAPKGWQFTGLNPTQPGAMYTEFRHERGAELGRPIHMPMLVVFLTAADANFSSAQYEGTVYCDGVAGIQGFIERRSMTPIVNGIIAELVLKGMVGIPKKFDLVWTWNVPAHANIEKFVSAIRMMIEDGLISQAQAAAKLGLDWEKVQASRERCAKDNEDKKLPPAPANAGSAGSIAKEDEEADAKPPSKKPPAKKPNARFSVTH